MYQALTTLPFCAFIESLVQPDGFELVIFDTEIERGQKVIHDIRYQERLGVAFDPADASMPLIYALRSDFPVVPHQLSTETGRPARLCVYEQGYDEFKLDWSAVTFVEAIRNWLSLTARGELHQEDQPLEPLLLANRGILIFPPSIIHGQSFEVFPVNTRHKWTVLSARKSSLKATKGSLFYALVLQGQPQSHGIIDKTPGDLTALAQLLGKAKIDLFQVLKQAFGSLYTGKQYLEHRLLLLLALPKLRDRQATLFEHDFYAVLTADTIREVGEKLGFWRFQPAGRTVPQIRACKINVLIPHLEFSPEMGATVNGLEQSDSPPITLIGAGALGSQLFMNVARTGYGRWMVLDDDLLLPHNVGKHALSSEDVGKFKSEQVARRANELLNNPSFARAMVDNLLHPSHSDELAQALVASKAVVDASASIAVARTLALDTVTGGKKLSVFLNPLGTDLVLLAEDEAKTVTLDVLEMQYYRYLCHTSELADHLAPPKGIRYAVGCRDITSTLPQHLVALHAAIAAYALPQTIASPDAVVNIWESGMKMDVKHHQVPIFPVRVFQKQGWRIVLDGFVQEKISSARKAKLPNETGGILLGGYDQQRRIVYIVDSILSPKDSKEYPTAYIRGIDHVEEQLRAIAQKTAGYLKYIGEWHSHPPKCSLQPSSDDKRLFAWLSQHMQRIGLPPLMLIAGDDEQSEVYIEQVD